MLGYKIPVVWPENEWYMADKSKPIMAERRSRLRKSGRRRSQGRTMKRAGVSPQSKKAKPRTYPGAFFGFGPKDSKSDESTTTRTEGGLDFTAKGGERQGREVPQSKTAVKSEESAKPKKKRPRRKKKSPPRTAANSQKDLQTKRA
jgi:hypothetical protein